MPGTNLTAATATEIRQFPTEIVQDVFDLAAPFYEVWFVITAPLIETIRGMSIIAWADPGGNYIPQSSAWTGSVQQLIAWPADFQAVASNGMIAIPVEPGGRYWIRVRRLGGTGTPNRFLHFKVNTISSTGLIRTNNIIVNDDTQGFPLVTIANGTGEVVKAVSDVAAGEMGVMGPLGYSAFSAELKDSEPGDPISNKFMEIRNPKMELVASVFPSGLVNEDNTPHVKNITYDAANNFYLVWGRTDGLGTRVAKFDIAGNELDSWHIPSWSSVSEIALAVTPDGSKLYAILQTSANQPIKAYDLVNDTTLSDFAPGISGYRAMEDMVPLGDGTFVLNYFTSSAPVLYRLIRYNASGTIIADSGNYSSDIDINRLAAGPNAPATFFAWMYDSNDGSSAALFRELDSTTFAIIEETPSYETSAGSYLWENDEFTDIDDVPIMGHSNSCPFMVAAVDEVIMDESDACCASCHCPGTAGPSTTPIGEATPPDPVIFPPPQDYMCVGGGEIPDLISPVHSEDWRW